MIFALFTLQVVVRKLGLKKTQVLKDIFNPLCFCQYLLDMTNP